MYPILRHKGTTLLVDNTPLQAGAVAETYLTAATTGGSSTTLTVANIVGFAINQILLIEDLGTENAEIVLTHASTAPTGTTITLTAALVKTHPVGSKVRVIQFNRFELSRATTATGSKTVLTVATTTNANPPSGLGSGLVAIDATTRIQAVDTVEHTSGFYFARYADSIHSTFSSYSDALVYGGWGTSTVGYIIDQALRDSGVEELSDKITRHDCYAWLTEFLQEVNGKIKHWPEHYSYNEAIAQTTRGINLVTMPSTAYDTETNKSVLAVRFGTEKNATYLDPAFFDAQMSGVKRTQVTTAASAGQTTLEIDNSYDFDDSGSVNVYVSGTLYTITYTGVTRSATAGILTGVPATGTGSITVTIAVDTYVWQNEDEGTPEFFTVRGGNLEYWPVPDSAHDNMNIYMDYAKVATSIDTDGDTIDYQRYDMAKSYLTWRIWCKARNDGELDLNSGFYLKYKEKLNDTIRTLGSPNVYRSHPKINRMMKGPTASKANLQDLPFSQQ